MKKILKIIYYILGSLICAGLVIGGGIFVIISIVWLAEFKLIHMAFQGIGYICQGVFILLILSFGYGSFLALEEKVKEYFKNRKREKHNFERR